MKAETIDGRPRRRRWPWLAVAVLVAAGVGTLLWRYAPPTDGTMAEVRSAVVLYEGVFVPMPPDDAEPGRPLTQRQRAEVEADLTARLRASCTPEFLKEQGRYAPSMVARVSRALARGEVYEPTHPYEYIRDFQFTTRTWDGALIFDVYEPGEVKVKGAPSFVWDSDYVSQRYRLEKVDGRWCIADVQHFGA